MEFESVQQVAERLGVTVRTVQKWAAAGKIPGAEKSGRDWKIPKVFDENIGDMPEEELAEKELLDSEVQNVEKMKEKSFHVPMPLLSSAFPIGKCKEFIDAMPDENERAIALGEYYHFSGQAELAVEVTEPYLNHPDLSLRHSAALVNSFANLSRGHIHRARLAREILQKSIEEEIHSKDPEIQAVAVFTATAAAVLLHMPMPEMLPLEKYLPYLHNGLRIFACYVLAHKEYLSKNYERSLGIIDMILAMRVETYSIAESYLHIMAAIDLMNLMRPEEAKKRLEMAWELSKSDGLLEGFGEHHGLLQGLIEIYFKKDFPESYEKIISITYSFSAGWRKIHNPDMNRDVADNLTTTEFTIAMLYNRGWTAKEIAAHMGMSVRTINNYIQAIYSKLGISDKKALAQFMLQ